MNLMKWDQYPVAQTNAPVFIYLRVQHGQMFQLKRGDNHVKLWRVTNLEAASVEDTLGGQLDYRTCNNISFFSQSPCRKADVNELNWTAISHV